VIELELLVQLFILIGVWCNFALGLIALKDRRKKNGIH
jgi:hypothetical protein